MKGGGRCRLCSACRHSDWRVRLRLEYAGRGRGAVTHGKWR
jgi:hypothetical protein